MPNVNAQVTIVGYHKGRAPGYGYGDELEYNRQCRWATSIERSTGECTSASESIAPRRDGEENELCCEYSPMEPIGLITDPMISESYWIVQNSWSETWGENGLAYIKDEEGWGVSGFNWGISYVNAV